MNFFGLHLQYPEYLLFLIPLLWLYVQKFRASGMVGFLRLSILLLLVISLCQPAWEQEKKGRILIVVLDQSASLPASSSQEKKELLQLLKENKSLDDRLGIVSFGQGTMMESFPSATPNFSLVMEENQSASDLAEGVELAKKMLGNNPGKILIFSDGKYTGKDPKQVALDLLARDVKVDFRHTGKKYDSDVALSEVSFPHQVDLGKPFQYSIWVESTHPAEATIEVRRDGELVASTMKSLSPGKNRFFFRDIISRGGTSFYEVLVKSPQDQVPQNNKGIGLVRAEAGPRILVLTPDGRRDNLTRVLEKSHISIDVLPPHRAPQNLAGLDRYRAVILENIPANEIRNLLEPLKYFVEDFGGGLLLTGGKQSFGVGGYHKSILDPILPVSMELRKEHHKLKVAICVALDRSGSMSMTLKDGRAKMDVANLGTCAVVELLSPLDEIAVFAVDTSPHEVIPLQNVKDPEAIKSQVLRIQSLGGGIFTYTALKASGDVLEKSDKSTRHIILFADAADAEEPGTYKALLSDFNKKNITVSVIALGKPTDPDAAFLQDVARLGKGRIFFASEAAELPQLFAQETITIAKSSFIDEPTSSKIWPDLYLLGSLPAEKFPTLNGYNLTYIKPEATTGITTEDEYKAPILAFWYRGSGRAAAVTAEADGKYSGQLNGWKGYGDFFVTVGRWILGQETPSGYYVETSRKGSLGIVYLEKEENRPLPLLKILTPSGKQIEGEFTLQEKGYLATFPLQEFGIYFPLISIENQKGLPPTALRCAPVALPYPSEFLPEIQNRDGFDVMARMAKITNGKEATHLAHVYDDIPYITSLQDISSPLCLLALILLVLEIAERRLRIFSQIILVFAWFFGKIKNRFSLRRSPKVSTSPSGSSSQESPPTPKAPEIGSPSGLEEKLSPPPSVPQEKEEKKEEADNILLRAKKKAKDRLQ